MVVSVAMSGIAVGIIAAVFAMSSGLSVPAALIAYGLTGGLAAVLVVLAAALRLPTDGADSTHETQIV
jgi:hypothetical protein